VPIVHRDHENLQESSSTVDPRRVSQVAGSQNDVLIDDQMSESYKSENPSLSGESSVRVENSYKGIESLHNYESAQRDVQQSRVSIIESGITMTQWTSMKDDENSERNDSQVDSLQVVTEKREQSVKEVPVVNQDREYLQESSCTVDPKPVSQVAGSLDDASFEFGNTELYMSVNRSVSERTTLNAEESLNEVHSVAFEESIREAKQGEVSILGTGLSLTQE
jgi:hypothetical protein